MSWQLDSDDGVSRLTELMQHEQVIEKTAVDPKVRQKRRRFRLVVSGTIVLVLLAAAGSYVGITINAPIGAADATSEVPEVDPPAAAVIAVSPEGASAVSVSGADDYLGPMPAGSGRRAVETTSARSRASRSSSPPW